MSPFGTSRTCHDVRLESGKRSKADIDLSHRTPDDKRKPAYSQSDGQQNEENAEPDEDESLSLSRAAHEGRPFLTRRV
jgi:hypothetical protein